MNICFDKCFTQYSEKRLKNCDIWLLDYSLIHTFDFDNLKYTLSEFELQKYNQFYLDKHKHHYFASRVLIKLLLAKVLNCSLQDIQIQYTAMGKPYLEGPFSNYHINFSDSHEKGIIALSDTGPVGVDIEHLEVKADLFDTLSIFATPSEKEWVLDRDSLLRYYKLWTLKEAYLKCLGTGLLGSLPELQCSLDKSLGELYALPEDDTIHMYSNQNDNYIFSLVIRNTAELSIG